MQAITWNKEELQASVERKLAILRANRQADKGLTLDQRLVLVDDRLAFNDALAAADNRRALQRRQELACETACALRQTFVQPMSGQDNSMASKLFGHFFARVDDVGHANGAGPDGDSSAYRGSKPAQHTLTDSYAGTQSPQAASKKDSDKPATKPGQGERVDSHATDIKLNPRADKPFVPHAERYKAALKKEADKKALLTTDPEQASSGTQEGVSVQVGNQLQDRPDDSYTEVPADKVMFRPASLYGPDGLDQPEVEDLARRRLIDQTKRQSSSSWVVLDRATVLSCLKRKPEGMTMVEVAFDLLGAAASPRDTRRLSALMKREEDRKTVTVAGRNKPITLTPAGRAALELIDVKQTNLTAIERRQKRVQAQQQRLIGEAQKVMYENGKTVKNEQIKGEKAVLKTKKQAVVTPSLDPGVLVKDGVVVASTRKAPPANAAATPKKTRKSKSSPPGNTESD